PGLKHQDAEPGPGEVLGDQRAVDPGADDHDVVTFLGVHRRHLPAGRGAPGAPQALGAAQAPKPCWRAPAGCAPAAAHCRPVWYASADTTWVVSRGDAP